MWPFGALRSIRSDLRILAQSQLLVLKTLQELKHMSAETDAAVAALNASVDRVIAKMAGMGDVAPITAERDAALADLQALKDAISANQSKLDAA